MSVPTQNYEFGEFRLDAVKRQLLRRDGQRVPLTPRVFDTLLYLVQHPGKVLEKDELMRAVWPDVVVEENNLNQNVSALRRALGESRGENRYIVTVPGHGYRFAFDLKETTSSPGTPGKTIAVLPFINISADPENEYFCDGLAEELLNALARIDGLKVAARTSAFAFKGKNTNVAEIAAALGVNSILEGSVRRSGNRLRITAQLVNASDGYHLWSERYDREMRDIFDVQDEITLAVVDALKVKLLGGEKAAALKRYTDNTEAYQLYLKGRYFWSKSAPYDFKKCRDYFEQAVAIDSTYALGYSGLAHYYGFASSWGMMPPTEGWPRMKAAVEKAVDLDDSLAEVAICLGAFKMAHDRDWAGAEKELKHAIELNPNFPTVHSLYSLFLTTMRRFDEALAEGKRALELDPLSLRVNRNQGMAFYNARRYDDAIRQYGLALELDPNDAAMHELLGDAYEQKRMHSEALAQWRQTLVLIGNTELAAILDNAFTEKGFAGAVRAVAQRKLEQFGVRIQQGEYVPSMYFARAHIRLGDKEQAFRWLDKACEEQNAFPLFMNTDPFYDSLRSEPRFANLLRRIGFLS